MLKTASLIGLVLYFAVLLLVVLKEKKNSDVEDYFFAGRSLPFWALSITFIASWWGGGSALSTADLAFADGMGACWYYGVPVLVATLLMGLGARAIRSVGYLTQGAMMEARYSRPVARLLAAVVFVGISAAIMSTMDSLINTGAMTLVMDLLPGSYDEKTRLRLSRLATLVIVAVGILISLRIRSIFEITWIASDIITTGVFVPLVLAFFWRRGTSRGALCSMLCGLAYCLYNLAIFLGMPLPAFWEQQSALQVILGVCLSLLVFTVTSLLDEPEYHKADAFLARTRQQAC